jgi:hypothetical protein
LAGGFPVQRDKDIDIAGDGRLDMPPAFRSTQMWIEDKMVNLSLGMAVTAEIKTGSRTVLSYLLSPVLKYKHDSLRER